MTQQQADRTWSADGETVGSMFSEEGESFDEFPSLGQILNAVYEQLNGALRQI